MAIQTYKITSGLYDGSYVGGNLCNSTDSAIKYADKSMTLHNIATGRLVYNGGYIQSKNR